VEGQRKEAPQPVVIEGEEEWEVEKVINKRKVQGKDKPGTMERMYGRRRYLGEQKELEECNGVGQEI